MNVILIFWFDHVHAYKVWAFSFLVAQMLVLLLLNFISFVKMCLHAKLLVLFEIFDLDVSPSCGYYLLFSALVHPYRIFITII